MCIHYRSSTREVKSQWIDPVLIICFPLSSTSALCFSQILLGDEKQKTPNILLSICFVPTSFSQRAITGEVSMPENALKNQILKDLLVAVLRMALGSLGADFPLCLLVSALAANNRHPVSRLSVQHIMQTLNSLEK